MSTRSALRTLSLAAVVAAVPMLAANAQSTAPTQDSPPAATRPEATPMPSAPPAQKPVVTPRDDKSAKAPVKVNDLVGLAVFASDGNKLGNVQKVATAPDGKVTALHIKSGGFLGFGGKMVAIPEGKFTRTGDNIQLGMTAEEVSKLPEVKDQS
jgi:sporulation protein YlmC with PRC-barrel domain